MNQDLKIIKTVFMPGQKKGKKFMVSKRENEAKEKIQQPGEEKRKKIYSYFHFSRPQQGRFMECPYKGLVITMWFINLKSALITPIIFKVNLNAVGFEQWLAQHLLLSLKIPSVLLHG